MASVNSIMANKAVQKGVALFAGIATSAGTYFLVDLAARKIAEKREASMYEEYEDLADDYTTYPDIPEGVNQDPSYSDRVVNEKYDKPNLVDYTRYSKIVDDLVEKASKKKETETEEDSAEIEEDNPACSFITEKEYLDAVGNYAKADATYFTTDKLLAGWNEDLVIRDIPSTVGWKAIRAFDDPSVKSVYVRNSDLEVDYEIVRCDDLFDEVVQETIANEE